MKKLKKFIEGTQAKFQNFKDRATFMSQNDTDKIENIKKPKGENKSEHVIIEFSLASVLKSTLLILIVIAFSKFVEQISTILILLFIALLLSATFDPTVDYLQKKGVPRAFGVICIYILAFVVIGIFISTLVPLMVSQLGELATRIANIIYQLTDNGISDIPFYDKIKPYMEPYIKNLVTQENQQVLIDNLQGVIKNIASKLSGVAGNVFAALATFFNGVFNLILVLVLTFFMTVEEKNLQEFIRSLFPAKYGQYIVLKSKMVKINTGNWLRGQLLLSLLMGIMTFTGMWLIGIEFALTLGMFSAIAEFIPVIGPSITAVAAILIALNQEFWQVIAVVVFFILEQFVEGNLLVPIVMRKAVNLNPVAVITAALVAYQFLGITGLILAIPSATVISIFVKDYAESQK